MNWLLQMTVPRRVLLFAVLVVGVLAAFVAMKSGRVERADRRLVRAHVAMARGDYETAARIAEEMLRDGPSHPVLLLAGAAAQQQQQFIRAAEFYARIPDDGSREAVQARCAAGEMFLTATLQVSKSEEQFRRALQQDPDNAAANDHLAWLLGLSTRRREAIPWRLRMISGGRAERIHVFLLALGDLARENPAVIEEYRGACPDDPGLTIAAAEEASDHQDDARARLLLAPLVASRPELIEAQVRLGRTLLEDDPAAKFSAWVRQLPTVAWDHPGIWAIQGLMARRLGDEPTAVRCFWESVRRDPCQQQTSYQLGQALTVLGRDQDAAPFLKRSAQIQQYLYYVHSVHRAVPGRDLEELRSAAESAAALGLIWEAVGWAHQAAQENPPPEWSAQLLARWLPMLPRLELERCIPEQNPAQQTDLSEYPLPEAESSPVSVTSGTSVLVGNALGHVRFEDQASACGIDFSYFNGGDPHQIHFVPLWEQPGGGIAALDFDADGSGDLHLTQGCAWPPDPGQTRDNDRLYRNTADGHFSDVTREAGIRENGFSHGAGSGDFDGDGFADLYVGNFGPNRLYRNNGDGTFADVTQESGAAGEDWTTSCMLADLNGDAWPDVYAVNYLSDSELFSRVCRDADGNPRPCMIQSYPAAQDRLYLNLADGTFRDITTECGLVVPDGRGLGIVAADFSGSGRLSVCIANDASPNFWFVNTVEQRGAFPMFQERAMQAGFAVNRDGEYESGMGVAADDCNGDGLIDVFVTNFERESNTLYCYQQGGMFVDMTRQSGLREPSLDQLGFGTQFVDGDLDGRRDLIVTNGHVDDLRSAGRPYQMPPQFFRNIGGGRFEELPGASVGHYFENKYLGRGMARIDWNSDGREDVAISHLDAPLALLTNTTETSHHFLTVRLIGSGSSRDAVGTTVTVSAAGLRLVRQLTGGDGYLASNQRILTFGLSAAARVDTLDIVWPSGIQQHFENVAADAELVIRESCPDRIFPLTGPLPGSAAEPRRP